MAALILSDTTKQQLEQERSRLYHDRETIIASMTTQVEQEIEQLIQGLNALLGEPVSAAPVQTPKSTSKPTTRSAQSPAKAQNEAATSKKTQSKLKPFDANQLKREFKGMNTSDAIAKSMQQSSATSFTTDELIAVLYDAFDEATLPGARRSVSAVLMHGLRAGKFEKHEGNPSRYSLK